MQGTGNERLAVATAERTQRTIVEQSHIIADLDTERARMLRKITEARDLLRDVEHMIAHGNLDVAREYVDRALTALSKGLDR